MTAVTASADLRLRPYTDADEREVLALLERSLSGGPTGRRSSEFFRWKHLANPFGRSFGLVAEVDEKVVGVRLFLRWRFTVGGRDVRAVRAVDTATHPDFRGRGIFRRLTLAALDDVRRDTHLVFNTPNSHSLPGYLKMGWSHVGIVPVFVRPTRPFRFLAGVRTAKGGAPAGPTPACTLPPVAEAVESDAALATLLSVADRTGHRLSTPRSPDYLRWRYAEPRDLDYRAVCEWRGDELVGLAIGRPRLRGRLAEFTLSELIVRSGDVRTASRLLRAVAGSGCDHVATHVTAGTTAARAARRSAYMRLPGRGMVLVARPLTDVTPDPLLLGSWGLSLGDLEVF